MRMSVHLKPTLTLATPLIGALILGTACSGMGEDPPLGDISVELGTGSSSFEPLQDGDDIYITQGPQGGYHFFGSARIKGLIPGTHDDLADPDNPTTEFRIFRGNQRVDGNIANYVQGYEPVPGSDLSEMHSRIVIIDIEHDSELDGDEVRFEVTVTDADGVSASDERTLTAIRHPNNI